MSAPNVVFSVFSGIGLILSLIPLYWHLDSLNVGTCMYMIWTALGCLVYFVNAVVWDGNAINWAPVWCDISTRIQIGFTVALPACGLCIIRRLYFIATTTTVTSTRTDKRREMIVDFAITLVLPVLQMLLQLVVSGHRFDIFENFGCLPTTYPTPVTFVLVWSWPIIIAFISATYGVFTIYAFMKRRKQFKAFISSNSALTYNRYWRLIILASLDFIFTIPILLWNLILISTSNTIHPWISWENVHQGYSRVEQYSSLVFEHSHVLMVRLELSRWAPVISALVFFAFFGFADEAKKNYRLLASTITKRFGFTTFTESSATSNSMVRSGTASKGGVSLPVFITQQTESKRDSFDSYSDKLSTSITIGEQDFKVQPYTPTEQSTSSSSSIISRDEVHHVPMSVLDPASVRRPSVPDAPKSVHPENAFDHV